MITRDAKNTINWFGVSLLMQFECGVSDLPLDECHLTI